MPHMLAGIFLISISRDSDFMDIAFEFTSAFGTVCLSRGPTGELDTFGRAVCHAQNTPPVRFIWGETSISKPRNRLNAAVVVLSSLKGTNQ